MIISSTQPLSISHSSVSLSTSQRPPKHASVPSYQSTLCPATFSSGISKPWDAAPFSDFGTSNSLISNSSATFLKKEIDIPSSVALLKIEDMDLAGLQRLVNSLKDFNRETKELIEKSIVRRIKTLCDSILFCDMKPARNKLWNFLAFGVNLSLTDRFKNSLFRYFVELSIFDDEMHVWLFMSAVTDEIKIDLIKAYIIEVLDHSLQRKIFSNSSLIQFLSRIDRQKRGELLCLYAMALSNQAFCSLIKQLPRLSRTEKSLEWAAIALCYLENNDKKKAKKFIAYIPEKQSLLLQHYLSDLNHFRRALIQLCWPSHISLHIPKGLLTHSVSVDF